MMTRMADMRGFGTSQNHIIRNPFSQCPDSTCQEAKINSVVTLSFRCYANEVKRKVVQVGHVANLHQ